MAPVGLEVCIRWQSYRCELVDRAHDDGIRVHPGGCAVMEGQRNSSKCHLLAHIERLPRFLRVTKTPHQLSRHRFSRAVMLSERGENGGIPTPLLEHLRRRLAEVPLHVVAARSHPRALSTDDEMNEMTELVEEGEHVPMLQ